MLAVIGITGKNTKQEEQYNQQNNIISEEINEILYDNAYDILIDTMFEISEFNLISNGTAFSSHLAVRAFNEGLAKELILCLPAKFEDGKFENKIYGNVCNIHHNNFIKKCNIDSFAEISTAIAKGAKIVELKDFNASNNYIIENSDNLIAFSMTKNSIVEDYKKSQKDKLNIQNQHIYNLWKKANNHKFKRHIGYKGMRGFNY